MTQPLDEALRILEDAGTEFHKGFSNHGPMVAEVLGVLGYPHLIVPWVESYRDKLGPLKSPSRPISEREPERALGDFSRVGDWIEFYNERLQGQTWQAVVADWTPRLLPGIAGAATHGLIRAAHAVRALEAQETALRRDELARGLGYWAARYHELPGEGPPGRGALRPSEGLRQVSPLPEESRQEFHLITERLDSLAGFPPFAEAVDSIDTSGDVSSFISEVTESFSGALIANAHDPTSAVVFIHTVTAPSAVRLLAPHLPSSAVRDALYYAWQAAAALYAGFAEGALNESPEAPDKDIDQLMREAVATGHVHAIKFAEACRREHRINPKAVYLAATAYDTELLGGLEGGPHVVEVDV